MTWRYPSQHLIKSVEYSDLKFKKDRKERRMWVAEIQHGGRFFGGFFVLFF